MTLPRLITVTQAAEHLGCSYFTMRRIIRRNGIPIVSLPGSSVARIHTTDLAKVIQRHTFEATKARLT